MKYIKEYNEHSYYQRLPFMAIDDILYDDFLDITDKALAFSPGEIMSIKSIVKRVIGNSNIPYIVSQKLRDELGGKGYDPVQVRVSFNNDDTVLSIYKAADEWYYVSSMGFDGDYKCDQWEGLFKFIEYFYAETYKDYDFNKWVKLKDDEIVNYADSIKLSDLGLLDVISKWEDIPISNEIEKELLFLSKVKWAGLGGLDFVQKGLGKYIWIGSSKPHYVDDTEEEPVEVDGMVQYQPTGFPVEYYINIYKKWDKLYLVEEVSHKKGYKNNSEFFSCNSFEGVRDCIKFILRRRVK